ncbi:hypothetical protein GWI33_021403 [Rhynchophorus ferrugineus]|uniref:Ig-like domain-containing protein n=1 Tax=Rhynchophorus ferrugineus TaxID=354439 RepID=A0A834M2G6_RHYFE|nr:hypothetical protein GWI33_021403 [Rhynchophorus ferrugineus]
MLAVQLASITRDDFQTNNGHLYLGFMRIYFSLSNTIVEEAIAGLLVLNCMKKWLEINYDSPRGGVSVITEKGDITVSYLLIQKATEKDSGRYTCHPSNANPKTVTVHVLSGEHPAAMQHGGQLRLRYPYAVILLSILVTLVAP